MKYYRDSGPWRWRVHEDGTVGFYHPDVTGCKWVLSVNTHQDLLDDPDVYPCDDTEKEQL